MPSALRTNCSRPARKGSLSDNRGRNRSVADDVRRRLDSRSRPRADRWNQVSAMHHEHKCAACGVSVPNMVPGFFQAEACWCDGSTRVFCKDHSEDDLAERSEVAA